MHSFKPKLNVLDVGRVLIQTECSESDFAESDVE
jgi:hypothetical protein